MQDKRSQLINCDQYIFIEFWSCCIGLDSRLAVIFFFEKVLAVISLRIFNLFYLLWSISGLPTSFQELKLLGSSGWCMKPNMVSKPEVSSSSLGRGIFLSPPLPSLFPHLRLVAAACEWECCEVLVDCPPLSKSLSFWVHLVDAWNLTLSTFEFL